MDKIEAIARLESVITDLIEARDAQSLQWDKKSWNSLIEYTQSVKQFIDEYEVEKSLLVSINSRLADDIFYKQNPIGDEIGL